MSRVQVPLATLQIHPDAHDVVPLSLQEWADVAEAWAYFQRARRAGLDAGWSKEELSRRARTWTATVAPILIRHRFEPFTEVIVRTPPHGEFVMKARRTPESQARLWTEHQFHVFHDTLFGRSGE